MCNETEEQGMKVGLMTVRETADFLRLKESTIRDWVLRRKITFVKLGGRVFIRKVDAEEMIDKSIVPAISEPENLQDANVRTERATVI